MIDAFHQFVDAAGEALQIRILVGAGNAAGEVACGGGGNNAADAGLQILALAVEGGFLRFHFLHLLPVGAEDFQRPGHLADFVLAVVPEWSCSARPWQWRSCFR